MNKFVKIIPAIRYKKVYYYSVQFEDEEASLFLQFVNNHLEDEYKEQMAIIRTWLKKIGNDIGADIDYFRPEGFRGGDASALPPSFKYIAVECDLRLYCMRISKSIVILFNGAKKTAQTAQECPSVRPHFLLANRIAKAIDRAIIEDRDIIIDDENGELIFGEDLMLQI